jgi:hypothetical protein
MLQKKSHNPADRDAGKAFQRPPSYVEDGNPQHITKATFSENAYYP